MSYPVENPEDRFSRDGLIWSKVYKCIKVISMGSAPVRIGYLMPDT